MPIYEYSCIKCQFEEDYLENLNSSLKHDCPKCNGVMKRKISSPSIKFKGNGFYINDYKSPKTNGDSNKCSPINGSPKKKNLAS